MGSVEEAELEGEDDSMREFRVSIKLFHVFKSLQMQSQNGRQFFHSHPLLGLLLGMTNFAVVLLLQAEGF